MAVTAEQLEKRALQLLAQRFARDDDPGLAQRRRELGELFRSADAPLAAVYALRLSTRVSADPLSREFHDRLHSETREELLQILRGRPQAASKQNTGIKAGPGLPGQVLFDEDAGRERRIEPTDQEFLDLYVDFNIRMITSMPDRSTLEHRTMFIYYTDGRHLRLPLTEVPLPPRPIGAPPGTGLRASTSRYKHPLVDGYLLRKGIIYPFEYSGSSKLIRFNSANTPTVVAARGVIAELAYLRTLRVEFAELVQAFVGQISALGSILDFGVSLTPKTKTDFTIEPLHREPDDSSPGAARARSPLSGGGLKTPRVNQLRRGGAPATIDPKLPEMARELRATQAGIELKNFREFNIAVARVRVDGKVEYLDAGNIPGKTFGARRGLDSEQVLLWHIDDLRRNQKKKVVLEQLYSERIPCADCRDKLDHEFPEAAVFYTRNPKMKF